MNGATAQRQGGRILGEARPPIADAHLRTDSWWVLPVTVVVVLLAFIVYSTWAAFQNAHYFANPYLSPFYSPCLTKACLHHSFGGWTLPDFTFPIIGVVSPALLILGGPGLFRLTCYYYRKAYYRSFWLSPPACAVAEPHAKYTGETRFPLIIQNLHRYFFYAAVVISVINTYDLIRAFRGGDGGFGIGLGTLVMLLNVVMLWTYTASCHSCRHLMGGRLKHFSAHPVRYKAWTYISKINARHMQLAWITLGTLMLTDGYIALVASGAFGDLRIIN